MKVLSVCLGLLVASYVNATPIVMVEGTIPYNLSSGHAKTQVKPIKLLKMTLSDRAKKNLKQNISTILHAPKGKALVSSNTHGVPSQVQLGMNHVPVLDQGMHGTCVTFAVTAALDALIGQGDYISQLCPLILGNHIANNSMYRPSGWEGANAAITLSRISEYGIVSKEQEMSQGCGGLTEYPLSSMSEPTEEMTLVDYHALSLQSEPFYEGEHFIQTEILNEQQWLLNKTPMSKIEEDVKRSLYQGDRVLLAVFVPMSEWIGLEGKHNEEHDTWVLTGRIEYLAERVLRDPSQWGKWGGHEMVITGYDDSAESVDADGKVHQGLFTLRNSWGADVGDHGTFYMSYDYFRALAVDLIRIGNLELS